MSGRGKWTILGSKMDPFFDHFGSKMGQKTVFFDHFWTKNGSFLDPLLGPFDRLSPTFLVKKGVKKGVKNGPLF